MITQAITKLKSFVQSYASLVFGVVVVLTAGILFLFFARGDKNVPVPVELEPKVEQTSNQAKSKAPSTYTVKAGDSLWAISEEIYKDGYKWIEIAKVNKLINPDLIYPGNKFTIPSQVQEQKVAGVVQAQSEKTTEGKSITEKTYTIASGDNLWNISIRAYGDGYRWVQLASANSIQNPNLIYPNNVLQIPR